MKRLLALLPPSAALGLPLLLAACSGGSAHASFSHGGGSAEVDVHGVSGGGFRVETGEPASFYGTVLESGVRRYTYLVIARDLLPAGSEARQSNSGTARHHGDELATDHTLTVNGVQLHGTFTATIGELALVGEAATVNGREVVGSQWLFLFDAKHPNAQPVPVEAEMPDVPEDLAALADFTDALVAELATSNETVRAFLAASN